MFPLYNLEKLGCQPFIHSLLLTPEVNLEELLTLFLPQGQIHLLYISIDIMAPRPSLYISPES